MPEGMYIATYDYWRPCYWCSVLEGEGVAFLEDAYDPTIMVLSLSFVAAQ